MPAMWPLWVILYTMRRQQPCWQTREASVSLMTLQMPYALIAAQRKAGMDSSLQRTLEVPAVLQRQLITDPLMQFLFQPVMDPLVQFQRQLIMDPLRQFRIQLIMDPLMQFQSQLTMIWQRWLLK